MPNSEFGAKLDLVLKALSMSRGRLAAELRVDKSLVGRWVAGSVTPSAHNLANLTLLIAAKRDGFSMIDWELNLARLGEKLGIDPRLLEGQPDRRPASGGNSHILPQHSVATAQEEIARRGAAYEGFWRCFHPSFTLPGRIAREQAIIQREQGLLRMRMGGQGFEIDGPLMLIGGQLYGILADTRDHTFGILLMNGENMPYVTAMEGIYLAVASDRLQTPTAAIMVMERAGDLTGDAAVDEAAYAKAKEQPILLDTSDIPEALPRLLRAGGANAFPSGGDLLLRVPYDGSLPRGGPRPTRAT